MDVENEQLEDEELLVIEKLLPPETRTFQSRDELLEYVRNFSLSQGYATSIRDSKAEKYVTIGCDRSGVYRNRMHTPVEERKRKTSTHLIGCPFRIKGTQVAKGSWILEIKDGSHNHEASIDMSGHPSCRRLKEEEVLRVKEMTKSFIPPCKILKSLRGSNPKLQAISKTIYNLNAKIQNEELGGRTPIQALLEELSKGGFIHDYRLDVDKRLTHLFFAHPHSMTLTKSYPNVFVMDCTYKTNMFRMPLLDVIGVSSFNTSFYSCFVFISKEAEEDYIWALSVFKKMLDGHEPTMIVSDRELALMNAIRVVFPSTINLICVWHVEKNLVSNCKEYFKGENDDWDLFLSEWTQVIQSETASLFHESYEAFASFYKEKDVVINYIKRTWLPCKEHIVRAWTDVHLHFGNQVTSRA